MDGTSLTGNSKWFGEREKEAGRNNGRVVTRSQRREHNEKRLIRDSRRHVASSYESPEPLRELLDKFVGYLRFHGFAQLPEPVELQTENTDRSLIAPCKGDRLFELHESQVSSRQAGQVVDQTKRAQLLPSVAEAHERTAVGEHQDHEGLIVRLDPRVPQLDPFAIAYLEQGPGSPHELAEVLIRCLRPRPPSDGRRGRIPKDQLPIRPHDRDAIAGTGRDKRRQGEPLGGQLRRQRGVNAARFIHATPTLAAAQS